MTGAVLLAVAAHHVPVVAWVGWVLLALAACAQVTVVRDQLAYARLNSMARRELGLREERGTLRRATRRRSGYLSFQRRLSFEFVVWTAAASLVSNPFLAFRGLMRGSTLLAELVHQSMLSGLVVLGDSGPRALALFSKVLYEMRPLRCVTLLDPRSVRSDEYLRLVEQDRGLRRYGVDGARRRLLRNVLRIDEGDAWRTTLDDLVDESLGVVFLLGRKTDHTTWEFERYLLDGTSKVRLLVRPDDEERALASEWRSELQALGSLPPSAHAPVQIAALRELDACLMGLKMAFRIHDLGRR